jgi:hypothetical protein
MPLHRAATRQPHGNRPAIAGMGGAPPWRALPTRGRFLPGAAGGAAQTPSQLNRPERRCGFAAHTDMWRATSDLFLLLRARRTKALPVSSHRRRMLLLPAPPLHPVVPLSCSRHRRCPGPQPHARGVQRSCGRVCPASRQHRHGRRRARVGMTVSLPESSVITAPGARVRTLPGQTRSALPGPGRPHAMGRAAPRGRVCPASSQHRHGAAPGRGGGASASCKFRRHRARGRVTMHVTRTAPH